MDRATCEPIPLLVGILDHKFPFISSFFELFRCLYGASADSPYYVQIPNNMKAKSYRQDLSFMQTNLRSYCTSAASGYSMRGTPLKIMLADNL